MFQFANEAGIAPELPFGFANAMTGWVCFEPRTPDFEIRPRVFPYIVGSVNLGKTPFGRHCVAPFFHGLPGEPAVVRTHKQLFKDGGNKGLLLGLPTQADFASRMNATKGTSGQHFWATDEGVNALDTAHAFGSLKFTPKRDPEK